MKKSNLVDIITMGCSKNLVDTEHVMRQLESNGYRVKHDSNNPEGGIVIINTCGFIGDAKEESINTILQFAELKQAKKIDKLIVMGCLSQRYLEELKFELPEVDHFYGKFDFKSIINDLGKAYRPDLELERTLTTPPHYAYVKISEGCDRTCSYCAIPIITGKHQSRPIEEIVDEGKWLVSQGVKEFQLIAQDLSYYGYDLYKKSQLAELTQRLSDIKGVEWIRLHYAYPAHFPFDILPVIHERDNVCNYLDIALQHSSDHMLKLMRRNVTAAETKDLLARIRSEVPGIHLRTTLLVGHPEETEEDMEQLKAFVSEQKFERLGVFAYSHEESTYAHKHYKDNIPDEVKQQRVDDIMELQRPISAKHNEKKVGQTFKVIIDREETEYYVGRTEFDSPEVDPEVLISKTHKAKTGHFYPVKITTFDDYDLFGEITNPQKDEQ
jgi:ribosomal protein S12 methylthiotransferase